MQRDEVKRHFLRMPFTPLLVRMVSGHVYRVRTPESVVTDRFASFIVERGLIEVVALEFIEAIRPMDSNGSHRRRGGGAAHVRRR